jgi:hypothetical protein
VNKLIFRIRRINWVRGIIIVSILLVATIAYATSITKLADPQSPYVWIANLFNGWIPVTILGWFAKRYLDYVKEVHKELIEAKNKHSDRLTKVETHFEDCPSCKRRVSYPD